MKKALIWLSVGLNVLVLSVVILALNYRAEWIDLYPLFLDEDGSIADQYSNDELHLHGAGYTVWADAIGERVRVPSIPNSSE